MLNCHSLDPLVTPFVDGALADAERRAVEDHLRLCPPCHSRVAAERAVHDLLRARKATLVNERAPDALHVRCASLAARTADTKQTTPGEGRRDSESRIPNLEFRTPP